MRRSVLLLSPVLCVSLLACPRPKDEDGTQDSGAERGSETGEEPKPAVKQEPIPK
jgi:hypothetical protein